MDAAEGLSRSGKKKPPPDDRHILANGAILALRNARRFLEDGALLYSRQRFPSAVMLAVSGLEEVGRFRMLHEALWHLVRGEGVPQGHWKEWSSGHLGKIQAGLGPYPRPPDAITKQLEQAKSPDEIVELLNKLTDDPANNSRETAKEIHDDRIGAQYLDFDHQAGAWTNPMAGELVDSLNSLYEGFQMLLDACWAIAYSDGRLAYKHVGIDSHHPEILPLAGYAGLAGPIRSSHIMYMLETATWPKPA